jgi:hypothetical protein
MLFNSGNGSIEDNSSEEMSLESYSQILEAMILENLSPEEILEGLADFNEVKALVSEGDSPTEVLTEKSIVRLDKAARLHKARSVAVYTVAKEKGDPLFKKLLTIWRAERFINEAMRRAKKVASARPLKSAIKKKTIDRVALRVKRQLNAMKDTKAKSIVSKLGTN